MPLGKGVVLYAKQVEAVGKSREVASVRGSFRSPRPQKSAAKLAFSESVSGRTKRYLLFWIRPGNSVVEELRELASVG
jgi:hypothetical protein